MSGGRWVPAVVVGLFSQMRLAACADMERAFSLSSASTQSVAAAAAAAAGGGGGGKFIQS